MIRHVQVAARRLAAIEIWVVAGAVALSVVSMRVLPIAVLLAGGFWLVRWCASGRLMARTPADWPVAILVLLLPLTLWVSAAPATTYPQVYRVLTGVLLFYAIIHWAVSEARIHMVVYGLALVGVLIALSAPFSLRAAPQDKLGFIPSVLYEYSTPLVADSVNPNVLAGALVILAPLVFAVALFAWGRLRWVSRIGLGLATILICGMLVLTQSRGGLIALLAALIMIAVLRWRVAGWVLLPAVVLSSGVAVFTDSGLRFVTSFVEEMLNNAGNRPQIWIHAVRMIQDAPFTGIGMGLFQPLVEVIYPYLIVTNEIPHAHNVFLQVAVDLGIPGLIAWLAILVVATFCAWRVYRLGQKRHDSWMAGLGAGLLGSYLALSVHGLIDAVTWGMVRTAVIVWGLWALAVASGMVYEPRAGDER